MGHWVICAIRIDILGREGHYQTDQIELVDSHPAWPASRKCRHALVAGTILMKKK